MKSYLTVASQWAVLGSLVMYESEDHDCIKEANQEDRVLPSHYAVSVSVGEELFFPQTFFNLWVSLSL